MFPASNICSSQSKLGFCSIESLSGLDGKRRFVLKRHHRLQALRRNVVVRRQIAVVEDVGVIGLHPLGNAMIVGPAAVAYQPPLAITPGYSFTVD